MPPNNYEEEKKMRDILQMLGAILGVIATIIVYVNTILRYKSSKKDKLAEAWLYEGFFFGSAVGTSIITVFLLVSLLF